MPVRPRAIVHVLVLLLVAVGLTFTHTSAARAVVAGDDYPANLKTAPRDALVDPWRFYNRECTSFVAWRLNRDGYAFTNFTGGQQYGDAIHWGVAAKALGIAVNSTPAIGSVAWTTAGRGHVAYVSAVNNDGTVTIEEYNVIPGMYDQRTVPVTDFQYIHFHDLYPDGTFLHVASDNSLWRVAGGSPIPVTSWDPFGGPQPVTEVTVAQLAAMPAAPADGTTLQALPSGVVMTVQGRRVAVGGNPALATGIGDDALARIPAVLSVFSPPMHAIVGRRTDLRLWGTGFIPGTVISAPGITLGTASVSSTALTTSVTPAKTAKTGALDLTVRGPDGAKLVCQKCLVVDPIPVAATTHVVTFTTATGPFKGTGVLQLSGTGLTSVSRHRWGMGISNHCPGQKGTVEQLRDLRVLVGGQVVRTVKQVTRI